MEQKYDPQSEQFVSDGATSEDIERMADEGGGVVIDQTFSHHEPVLRNDLVRTNKPAVDDRPPEQY